MRTNVDHEETMIAGQRRGRVLTLIDELHRKGAITFDKYVAADRLRLQIMAEMPPSEGVSSYGSNVYAPDPVSKSDRHGRRHTGYEVQPDGTITYKGRRSRSNMRELEDALFAACGVHDTDGRRIVNLKHVNMLMRIVTESERIPTQKELTLALTDYYGEKSKQTPPYSLGWLDTILGRLAQHYALSK